MGAPTRPARPPGRPARSSEHAALALLPARGWQRDDVAPMVTIVVPTYRELAAGRSSAVDP